ncbi:hypothetical protein [Falsirhodobacter sp. 20TX0035]|uniref:hypothetical protein n=1 Tax=Falsirhodobacter sp. 20TX0035 TaxID=3022019 RepID=UPI00232DAE8A|nr:hypothetical protein [Falsirhodobacter sp. 20TX0035]MDB6454282.1 hypothetical protein [Falsirhodobacter sp. 20TX0035]
MIPRWAIAGGALALAFAAGVWLGVEWQAGRQAQREVAERVLIERRRDEVHAAEANRLAEESARDLSMGVLLDEARDDPDAGLGSLGVRDAQRLNAIR